MDVGEPSLRRQTLDLDLNKESLLVSLNLDLNKESMLVDLDLINSSETKAE